jgi:hypothetical protein
MACNRNATESQSRSWTKPSCLHTVLEFEDRDETMTMMVREEAVESPWRRKVERIGTGD